MRRSPPRTPTTDAAAPRAQYRARRPARARGRRRGAARRPRLEEAGFHPLEAVRGATLCGTEELSRPTGREPEFGLVLPGMLADLAIVDQNPVANFKVLYGTGHFRLDDATNRPTTVGGVKYTIKDEIVFFCCTTIQGRGGDGY